MAVLLRLEVVPNVLVQSLSLKQAFWVQLLILEAPIKIFGNRNKCMPSYFGGISHKCVDESGYFFIIFEPSEDSITVPFLSVLYNKKIT